MVCQPKSYSPGPNNIFYYKSLATKWLLWSPSSRQQQDLSLSELSKLYQQTHEKHKYELCQWKYFFSQQQLFIEFLSWFMKAFWASLTNQGLIESRLYEYFGRDIIWRRLVMMADLRDRRKILKMIWMKEASYDGGSPWPRLVLVMNGRWWAVSSINQRRRIRECNPATRDDKFRQATVFRAKCRPLQSSDITNTNILCMNEFQRWWVVVLNWESRTFLQIQ